MTSTTATAPASCPRCGRPSRGYAFGTTRDYLRCGNGHVWSTVQVVECDHPIGYTNILTGDCTKCA